MGREHERSKKPTILFNDTQVDVPTDFMGHEGDDRELFFGQLDIPVPYSILEEDNLVSVTFPDSGGYVTSVSLRTFAFSKNLSAKTSGRFRIISVKEEAGAVSLAIVGGEPLAKFDLLSSDDMSGPFESWTVDASDLRFDAAGRAVVVTSFSGSRRFFHVRHNFLRLDPFPRDFQLRIFGPQPLCKLAKRSLLANKQSPHLETRP